MPETDEFKFIADENVGRLARLLRLLGFDTTFFRDGDDSRMVNLALIEKRIILTRDSHIRERRLVTGGRVRSLLILSDLRLEQLKQVDHELQLRDKVRPYSRCLECNRPLQPVAREEVTQRVPPYVLQTQEYYVECPQCRRVYWKGTHWKAMNRELAEIDIGVDQ